MLFPKCSYLSLKISSNTALAANILEMVGFATPVCFSKCLKPYCVCNSRLVISSPCLSQNISAIIRPCEPSL